MEWMKYLLGDNFIKILLLLILINILLNLSRQHLLEEKIKIDV